MRFRTSIAALLLVAGCVDEGGDAGFETTRPVDTEPPVFQTGGLHVAGVGRTYLKLTWPLATDDRQGAYYKVSYGGVQRFKARGTSYLVTGLTPGTQYRFTVRAVDAAGNQSLRILSADAETTSGCTMKRAARPLLVKR